MPPFTLLTLYCVGILFASLLGGAAPSLVRVTHTKMQVIISLVGGLMLGVGLLHLLPHGIAEIQSAGDISSKHAVDLTVGWALFGLLVMFFLIRAFHFHQHDTAEVESHECRESSRTSGTLSGHGENHTHQDPDDRADEDFGAAHRHEGHFPAASHLSWIGVAAGLSLHTLIDGLALGAAVMAESHHDDVSIAAGLAVFFAILLHKPLDAMSITALMQAGGLSLRKCHFVNLAFAMMCPAGVLLLVFGADTLSSDAHLFVGCALGFSAGVFLCISLGDLLPELQFHSHDRAKLSAALLAGIALAWAIGFLEPPHAHDHKPSADHHGAPGLDDVHGDAEHGDDR